MGKKDQDLLGMVTVPPYLARLLLGVTPAKFDQIWKMRLKDNVAYTITTHGRQILVTDLIKAIYPEIAQNPQIVHTMALDFMWKTIEYRQKRFKKKDQDGGNTQ